MNLFKIVSIYYLIVNLVAFFAMGIDKRKARLNKWRIKEDYFFIISLIGGFIGYYAGMFTFHHKTKKTIFHVCFYVSLLIHGFIFFYYVI